MILKDTLKKNFYNMYMIGDIGNTETKICLMKYNQQIVKKINLKTNSISPRYLKKSFKGFSKYQSVIEKIIFSSVVPSKYKKIKFFIKKNFRIIPKELKEINLKKFIKIKVNKKQVGSDRIANAIGICKNKKNFIIIDFGTATTFDIVINKNYLGGVIAPGVNLSLKTLIMKASLIPNLKISKVSNVIGKNTKGAVKAGFYWGYTGLIDNLLKMIIKQTKKNFKIILTGGLSDIFKQSINFKTQIHKDLTIQGLFKVVKNIKE